MDYFVFSVPPGMLACLKAFFTTTAMTPKVAALPRNETEPRLSIAGFSAQNIRALLRANEWCAWESRNQQVVFLYDFCQERMFHILTSCDYRTSLRDS
jgi:hypothetical protein